MYDRQYRQRHRERLRGYRQRRAAWQQPSPS
jgi:hypothetical protein